MTSDTEPLPSSRRDGTTAREELRALAPFRVQVIEGPDRGRSHPLETITRVGTAEEAGLRLVDTTVSRLHIELHPGASEVVVRDLGSRNGTFVKGTRIQEASLAEGAEVTLGKTTLRVSRAPLQALAEPHAFGRAFSVDPQMLALFGTLERVARSDVTVLIGGETGTGKDLLSEGMHRASTRAGGPFVIFDCGAAAANLIESDLFGHASGAFTGATADRMGAFERASGGTLFLDEVGELPLELQPKLLRALSEGSIRRVGDDVQRRVDVRVVAATHRELPAEVSAGRFREDLYFRLAVVAVQVPPLRERRADIPVLARLFVRDAGRPEFELSAPLLSRMTAYDWPGNIRELRNFVESALAGAPHSRSLGVGTAGPDSVHPDVLRELPFKEAKERLLNAFTREYLRGLLEKTNGNVSEVARISGLARSHVHLLLSKVGNRE